MEENDILIEPDDMQVIEGDFFISNANSQNIKHILIASPGNYLLTPSLGVDLYKLQNSSFVDFRPFVSKVKSELRKDGYDNTLITGSGDNVQDKAFLEVTADRVTIAPRQTV